ncbi:hypothetical protein [Jeotgalibacillus salarius]|uniref:Uncharacterized protein n=1 Tax=Jeotgalibacillus salarius TaxID=546023 RepID=A0A4Y8LGI4_9BACL|nr:hypothetical protein [Jeotgalibacillus salarius]TFE00707.1 hypothetical protein E2626_12100 [Jeotgalibacillus salarius]
MFVEKLGFFVEKHRMFKGQLTLFGEKSKCFLEYCDLAYSPALQYRPKIQQHFSQTPEPGHLNPTLIPLILTHSSISEISVNCE